MRVKRYLVDSMPDAMQKIRTELGKDAVIISTKEIRSGGFLGMFTKKKIEVIAAMDSASEAAGAGKPAPPRPVQAPANPASGLSFSALLAENSIEAMNPKANAAPSPVSGLYQAPATRAPIYEEADSHRLQKIQKEQPPSSTVNEHTLLDEMKQMKLMMNQLAKQTGAAPLEPEAIGIWRKRLLQQEVLPEIVDRLLQHALEELLESEVTEASVQSSLRGQLHDILVRGSSKPLAQDTKIAHFVGPTGVGKTTTIAKLAAEQVLKHRRKVGFITSDTYRIAAVEQLKTYATILDVPLEVVFSPQDLHKAMDKLSDRDIIFMDTAGRNFRNEMYVSELNALLLSQGKSETYLVLSLTSKYKDMKAITENFNRFIIDKVLFTKMDETDSYGTIINLLDEYPMQLSYMTNGQSVPDDISPAEEQRIIDSILEAASHE